QYLKSTKGVDAEDAVLARYRDDLTKERNGRPVDSAGPLDFGVRLLTTAGFSAWETITYEKGTWVLRMLRQRLGDDGFHKLQLAMLSQYAAKPISDEDFRHLASEFVPAGQGDRSLTDFFDAWVYGTGIPTLRLRGAGRNASLDMSGVDDEFTDDIPLACRSRQGRSETRWVLASSGDNPLNLPRGESCSLPSPSAFLYSR
ncbi:MAG: M1 family aminopeptidase, partial [Bryobacteraceae bacterium]